MDFTVVIVTYNRLECLKKALNAFEKQNYQPKDMIVINNASNDGTYEFLAQWKEKDSTFSKKIINKDENTGGSGGFYTGLEEALKLKNDWIWLSDDDAYPDENALYFANEYIENNNTDNVSAICSEILNNGHIDTWHRRREKKGLFKIGWENVPETEYNTCFKLDLFSYVGCIINKSKLIQAGLTNKEYFIWYDDTEHSLRLRQYGEIICVPSIITVHDVLVSNEINWKYFYAIRNYNDMIKRHYSRRFYLASYYSAKVHALLRLLNKNTREQGRIALDALRDVKNGVLGKK